MTVFYHNDMDGRCAAAVVAKYEGDLYKASDSRNEARCHYIEVDYIKPLPLEIIKDGEKVYLVDYAFTKNTVWQLEKLVKEKNCDVIYCDHHDSSIHLQQDNKYEWLKSIKGIRSKEASGAALTYMNLYKVGFDGIPYFIKLVSDYDCWEYKYDPDTTYFKLGLETKDYDALDDVWEALFVDPMSRETLLELGKIIKSYIDKDNKAYRDSYAYETEVAGIKCMAINRKNNSWIFGEKYYEYPIVMTYAFNGEKWSYSIFSSDPNVDCSKIAESFGGGGHRGAAGWVMDDMPFKKVEGKAARKLQESGAET
jgi:oligoribonuclease NrnB/cAMP/cGMP phosphodiesterase (DHH superfamily)